MSDNDFVGYCKPPRQTRFKKGMSGNPRGRPRGSLNLGTVVKRVLRERVSIQENGRRKTITKAQVIGKQLVNKAASGDLRAIDQLTKLQRATEQSAPQPTELTPESLRRLSDEELEQIAAGMLFLPDTTSCACTKN